MSIENTSPARYIQNSDFMRNKKLILCRFRIIDDNFFSVIRNDFAYALMYWWMNLFVKVS